MLTDKQIRQAIAANIRQALIEYYEIDDPSLMTLPIHDHWGLSFNPTETANVVRLKEDVNAGTLAVRKGKIQGWMIGLGAVSRNRPEPSGTNQGVYRLRAANPNRRMVLRSYRVWCYHHLDAGVAGNESEENSENRLAAEIEAVSDYFSNRPTLGLEDPEIMGHDELQFKPIDIYKFGEAQANVAQGTLQLVIQKPIRPVDT